MPILAASTKWGWPGNASAPMNRLIVKPIPHSTPRPRSAPAGAERHRRQARADNAQIAPTRRPACRQTARAGSPSGSGAARRQIRLRAPPRRGEAEQRDDAEHHPRDGWRARAASAASGPRPGRAEWSARREPRRWLGGPRSPAPAATAGTKPIRKGDSRRTPNWPIAAIAPGERQRAGQRARSRSAV